MLIHPTAIVDPKAELADGVEVGAYAWIGPHAKIGRGTKIAHHASIEGHTQLGEENEVGSFSVIGGKPQDLKYKNEPTQLTIGNKNVFREYVTVNTGTAQGGGVTKIGNECLIMSYCHVAHDCNLGDRVVMSYNTGLSGHVTIEDWVILSGMVGVSQFCRIGKHAFIGGMSAIDKDVAPFVIGVGNRLKLRGLNLVGLKRRGFDNDNLRALQEAYRVFFESGKEKAEALAELNERFPSEKTSLTEVRYFINFLTKSEGLSK